MGTKSKSFVLVIVALFLVSIVVSLPTTVKGQSRTIIVPDDYPNIQAAIGNSSSGDTIFVKKGVYNVHDYYGVLIDKSITLVGEDSQNTIINASRPYLPHQMIRITADNVTVSGFNINGGLVATGIDVEDSYSHVPVGCKIIGNYIHDCDFAGIIAYSSTSTLTGEIKYLPSYLTISGNNLTRNLGYGIYMSASNSTVTDNIIDSNNDNGMIVDECLFLNITNNRISNNSLSPYGENETGGLWLRWWGPFYITGNTITGNHGHGIGFEEFCSNSTISGNEISYNDIGIREFLVQDGGKGNLVYHNNFLGNQRQVAVNQPLYSANNYTQVDVVALNRSRDGNYWSDYFTRYTNASEVDSLGIGNTPYVLDLNNIDYYPLIHPVDIPIVGPTPTPTPTTSPSSIPTPTANPTTTPSPTSQPSLTQAPTISATAKPTQQTNSPTNTPSPTTKPSSLTSPNTSIPEFLSWTIPLMLILILATAGLLVYHKNHKVNIVNKV